MEPEITIRPLDTSDWAAFRDIRLKALESEPGVFASSYEREVGRDESAWRELVTGDDKHQVFGLCDGSKLIGATAVFTHRHDPGGETAILAMSFIEPDYRGRGLSRLLYQARLDWVRTRPQFKRVVVAHRESNETSRRANQAFGFQYVGREPHTWPDGVIEDEVIYELLIPR